MKKSIILALVIIITFPFIHGCIAWEYQKGPSKPNIKDFYKLSSPELFFDNQVDSRAHKFAFQDKSFNQELGFIPHLIDDSLTRKNKFAADGRIDIFVSNLDGSNKINITQQLYKGENAYFLFPIWSADGTQLAFVGYTDIKEQINRVSYSVETFVYFVGNQTIEKVNSSPGYYTIVFGGGKKRIEVVGWLEKVIWKKNSKETELDVSYILSDSFNRVSPNGLYKVDSAGDVKEYGPTVPVIEMQGIDIQLPALASKKLFTEIDNHTVLITPNGTIEICKGNLYHIQWTKDSKYALAFDDEDNRFYLINLKGEVLSFEGFYPSLQQN